MSSYFVWFLELQHTSFSPMNDSASTVSPTKSCHFSSCSCHAVVGFFPVKDGYDWIQSLGKYPASSSIVKCVLKFYTRIDGVRSRWKRISTTENA